ncbi:MAG: cytochrome c biogenesis protein ResB [Bacteroidales bacterium]|jgi:hypothetical protein
MTVSLHLFAFPVNLIIGLCIVFLGWKFRKLYRDKYMTIALILLIAVSLVQGFMPAHLAFTHTWPFIVVLTVFLIVLGSRLFLKFSLAGFGLWLALWAGMLGTADASVTHVMVPRHEYALTSLPFTLRLEDFRVTRYQTGEPMEYRATVTLQDIDRREDASDSKENSVLRTLRVNQPVNYKGHQVYLMDYDSAKGDKTDYCIVMVTRQPWRWLVFAGILVLLAGALKTFFT